MLSRLTIFVIALFVFSNIAQAASEGDVVTTAKTDNWGMNILYIENAGQSSPPPPPPPPGTCNVTVVADTTEDLDATHEACEILVLGPDFIVTNDSKISANSGWEIDLMAGFLVEQGSTFNANVCGQSLCITSSSPMPYGCHSCVDQICTMEPSCCGLEFDQACVDKVSTVCGLVCK